MSTDCIVKVETTGLSADKHAIVKIKAIAVDEDTYVEVSRFEVLVKPWEGAIIDKEAMNFNKITEEQLASAVDEDTALGLFTKWCRENGVCIYASFNIAFTMGFLNSATFRNKRQIKGSGLLVDIKMLANNVKDTQKYSLKSMKEVFGIDSALGDCESMVTIYSACQ